MMNGFDEGKAEGKTEGKAESIVCLIRKKYQKRKLTAAIADDIEQEEDYVRKVIEIIENNTELTDAEVVVKVRA